MSELNCPIHDEGYLLLASKLGHTLAQRIVLENGNKTPKIEVINDILKRIDKSKIIDENVTEEQIKQNQWDTVSSYLHDIHVASKNITEELDNVIDQVEEFKKGNENKLFEGLRTKLQETINKLKRDEEKAVAKEQKSKADILKEQRAALEASLNSHAYEAGIVYYLKSAYDQLVKDNETLRAIAYKEKDFVDKTTMSQLNGQISKINELLKDRKLSREERSILNQTKEDLIKEYDKLQIKYEDAIRKSGEINSIKDTEELLNSFLNHQSIISDIEAILADEKLLSSANIEIGGQVIKLSKLIETFKKSYGDNTQILESLRSTLTANWLVETGNKYGSELSRDEASKWYEMGATGGWAWFSRYLGTKAGQTNPILSIIAKRLHDIHSVAHRISMTTVKKLSNLQVELAKSGLKTDVIMERDSDGKVTNYLISELNRGEFEKDTDIFNKQIDALLGVSDSKYMTWGKRLQLAEEAGLKDKFMALKSVYDAKYAKKYSENKNVNQEKYDKAVRNLKKLLSGELSDIDIESLTQDDIFEKSDVGQRIIEMYDNTGNMSDIVQYLGDMTSFKKLLNKKEFAVEHVPQPNPEFAKLMQNKAFAKYYTEILSVHDLMMAKYPTIVGNKKWLLPQIESDLVQNFVNNNREDMISTTKQKFKDTFRVTVYDNEFGGQSGINGVGNKNIPILFINKIDPLRLSHDITNMYGVLAYQASRYEGMAEALPAIQLVEKEFASRTIINDKGEALQGSQTTAYGSLLDMIETQLFGVTEKKVEVNMFGTKVVLNKIMNPILNYVGRVNLGSNIPSILMGGIKGHTDLMIESNVGRFTSKESMWHAEAVMNKAAGAFAASFKNLRSDNRTVKIAEQFEVFGGVEKVSHRQDLNKMLRITGEDLTFAPYELFDIKVKGTLLFAMLDNYRFVNGELMNLEEFKQAGLDKKYKWSKFKQSSLESRLSFAKDGDFLVLDENGKEHPNSEQILNDISSKFRTKAAQLTGMPHFMDKLEFSRNLAGKHILKHRVFFPTGIVEAFQPSHYDPIVGHDVEGHYVTAMKFLFTKMEAERAKFSHDVSKWGSLSEYQKGNIIKTAASGAYTAMLAILVHLAMLDPGDDDREESKSDAFFRYMLTRMYSEQRSFWNPLDFLNMMKDPTPALSTYNDLFALIKSIMTLSGLEEIESGKYKGMSPLLKKIIKHSYLKNVYEWDTYAEKDRYLKNQLGIN